MARCDGGQLTTGFGESDLGRVFTHAVRLSCEEVDVLLISGMSSVLAASSTA